MEAVRFSSILSVRSSIKANKQPSCYHFKDQFSRIPICRRALSVVSASRMDNESHLKYSSFKGSDSFLRSVLSSVEGVYLNRNPTAKAILELVHSADEDRICYDHLAFRTFGVNDHGIDSMEKLFLDYGCTPREELRFPAKKLRALWFSPPSMQGDEHGSRVTGPLPRVFISELLVDQMSPQAQVLLDTLMTLIGK